MSQVTLFDTNHDEEYDLNVNVLDNDFFNDITSGTFIYDGITWTITKSADSIEISQARQGHAVTSVDELNAVLQAAGIPGDYTADGSVQDILSDTNTTLQLHKDDTGSYPYYIYKREEPTAGSPSYTIGVYPAAGQSSSYSVGGGVNNVGLSKIQTYQIGDLYFFGLFVMDSVTLSTDPYTTIRLIRINSMASTNFVEVSKSPGEKGFRPITEVNYKNRGGGKKSGQHPTYDTDVLTQPGEPNEEYASLKGSGFINVYNVTRANLDNVGKALYGETLLTFLDNLVVNPLDFIIGLNIIPYKPHMSAAVPIKLGRWECSNAVPNGLGIVANGNPLEKQFRTIHFGTLYLAEMFESYLDYEASSFSLYLPFIGEVDIPVSEVMGGSIDVDYTIDFFTGQCVANVLCTKTIPISQTNIANQYSQHSYQGNCAVQVPISHISYSNLVGSLINAASAGLKGGVAGAAFSLAGDLAGGGFKPTVQTKGTISANAGFCAILYPYITITRPITAEPESFQEVMGYPSYMDGKLATCQGLCICDDINLSGLSGATDSEISRIKQMCKEGIYI